MFKSKFILKEKLKQKLLEDKLNLLREDLNQLSKAGTKALKWFKRNLTNKNKLVRNHHLRTYLKNKHKGKVVRLRELHQLRKRIARLYMKSLDLLNSLKKEVAMVINSHNRAHKENQVNINN